MFETSHYEPSSLTTIFGMWERQPKPAISKPVAVPAIPKPVPKPAPKPVPKPVAVPEIQAVAKPTPKIEQPVAKPKPAPEPVPKPKSDIKPESDDDEKPRRLKVIQRMLEKSEMPKPQAETSEAPKPKKTTIMSKLWSEARAKQIPGYNRMKRADLERALSQS
jgi:hypothetical protein